MNAKSSGFISGAASGAAAGSQVWPGYGTVIGGVIGGVVGMASGASTDASQENQQAWNTYAAQTRFNTNRANLEMQSFVAMGNAGMALALSRAQADSTRAVSGRNALLIREAARYNDSLLEREEELLWESADLDIAQLGMQRARERGGIIAAQAASGTVIGTGSNKDIVVAQMAMEAFDELVIRHGAEVQSSKIADARAIGLWQGEVAAKQTEWQGNLSATMSELSTRTQVMGMLAQTGMNTVIGSRDARQRYTMDNYGIQQNQASYESYNQQNMISGLFSAAATGVKGYTASYTPETNRSLSGNWQPYGTRPGSSLIAA